MTSTFRHEYETINNKGLGGGHTRPVASLKSATAGKSGQCHTNMILGILFEKSSVEGNSEETKISTLFSEGPLPMLLDNCDSQGVSLFFSDNIKINLSNPIYHR